MSKTIKELLDTDHMLKMSGMINPDLATKINAIDPNYILRIKVKGSKFDRGIILAPVSDLISGSCLESHEYVSQVTPNYK